MNNIKIKFNFYNSCSTLYTELRHMLCTSFGVNKSTSSFGVRVLDINKTPSTDRIAIWYLLNILIYTRIVFNSSYFL